MTTRRKFTGTLLAAGALSNFNAVNADMNADDEIAINDVATLIDYLLTH